MPHPFAPLASPRTESAFSLVELSIVLVILGLLVGGVLSGRSLIHASELRAVSSEYQRYLAATHSFRDKYFAIPGDMTNATSFWGKNAAYCNGHAGTASATGTCNGDGNGAIWSETMPGTPGVTQEMHQFWNQLALAGLIEGKFTGIASGTGSFNSSTMDVNTPASKYPKGGWSVETPIWSESGDPYTYVMKVGNAFLLGAAVSGASPYGKILNPGDAWNIDTKLDDGKPARGKIVTLYWNNECAAADDGSSANNDLVASYRISDATAQCALKFIYAF